MEFEKGYRENLRQHFFSFIDETRKLNRGGTRNIIFGPKNMTEM